MTPPAVATHPWWRHAVYYQVYIRSFADGNGDGVGDLLGLRARLDHLGDLGVDAVWITPHYPSPMADHGYDVADYRGVDPLFGTLDDIDGLIADLHARGIRLVLDLVPNHTSDQHAWFQEAIADPASPARSRYIFRDGRGPTGDEPPNNWRSVFGGPAWSREPSGDQWYLHLFAPEQPDLDWTNEEVRAEFDSILRFWLDRGVDGFRIDVAHGCAKDPELRDNTVKPGKKGPVFDDMAQDHSMDQDAVHEIWRRWRMVVEHYDGDRVLIAEAFLWDPKRLAMYVRPDELHLAFNFLLLGQQWDAASYRTAIEQSTAALAEVGASASWVLSNHDVIRHPTRFGGGDIGQRRARAAALISLGMPGCTFVYGGEELGLEQVDVPPEARQDPVWFNSGGTQVGRDGCRVAMPWDDTEPACGFSTVAPWLPMPVDWSARSVASQVGDEASMLTLYRGAIAARNELLRAGAGLAWMWRAAPKGVLCIDRGDGWIIAINQSGVAVSVPLPWAAKVRIASDPAVVSVDGATLRLGIDAGAWITPA